MAQIPFKHAGCNGWAIYKSQYIDSDNAKNMHIAEVRIEKQDNGGEVVYLNKNKETICGLKLVSRPTYLYLSKSASDIRSKMAELQNGGHEVCGTCVSHFYADGEA